MRVEELSESTVAGAVASVAKPLGKLKERTKVPGLVPAEKVMTGKTKKKGPYANSISEGAVKQLAYDLANMGPDEFQKVYKQTKDFFTKTAKPAEPKSQAASSKTGSKVWHDTGYTDKNAAKQADEPIKEDELNEEDLIILPGMLRGKDKSFVPREHDRRDHEVEMARSDLYAAAKDAMRIFQLLANRTEDEGLMGWQQSYITLASDYLNSVADSLEYEGMTNEGLIGKFAKTLAQKSLNDLPKTPEVDRAIANRANRYAKNMNDAGLYGTGLATGAMAQQVYDKSQNKTNPEDQLQPVQVTGKRIPNGMVTIEPMPDNSIRQPKFQAPQKVAPPLKPERGINKPGLRTASLDTNTNMIEGVIAGGMSNFEEDTVNEISDFKRKEIEFELRNEPKNNYQVSIDGRAWKVFADKAHADAVARKLRAKGKKAEVYVTGASPNTNEEQAPMFTPESKLDEKKDACYSKVKSRYKVWPSAYASGALSKCRKVGASNWGNKSKK